MLQNIFSLIIETAASVVGGVLLLRFWIQAVRVRPPRLAESPVQMECELHQIVRVGDGPLSANLIIGRIVLLHVAETVLDEAGQIDPARLDTIGRMGGNLYTRTRDRFAMERPR